MKITKRGLELTNDLVNDLVMVKDIKYRNGNMAVGRVISYCVPVSPINTYGQMTYIPYTPFRLSFVVNILNADRLNPEPLRQGLCSPLLITDISTDYIQNSSTPYSVEITCYEEALVPYRRQSNGFVKALLKFNEISGSK
jgi:hypothetical protein